MQNDDTQKDQRKAADELLGASADRGTKKQTDKSTQNKKKTKPKKKTFKQQWKSALPMTKLKIIIASIVAAGSAAVALIAYAGVLQTKWNFQSEHQPSITILRIQIQVDDTGKMKYLVPIQNSTDIEAQDFVADCEPFLNNKPAPAVEQSIPAKPTTIGGRATAAICGAVMGEGMWKDVLEGSSIFQLYVHFTYDGVNTTHSYCTKQQYDPNMRMFADLGICDASKPFPQ